MKLALVLLLTSFFGTACATVPSTPSVVNETELETPPIPETPANRRVESKQETVSTSSVTVDVDFFFLFLARTSTTGKEPESTFALAEEQISAMEFALYAKTSDMDLRLISYIRELLARRDRRVLSMIAQTRFFDTIEDRIQRAFWHRAVMVAVKGMDPDCSRRMFWWKRQLSAWSDRERRAFMLTYYFFETDRFHPHLYKKCRWRKGTRGSVPIQF